MLGVCAHGSSVESNSPACVHRSGHARTREPADDARQGEAFMDPAVVNGLHVARVCSLK